MDVPLKTFLGKGRVEGFGSFWNAALYIYKRSRLVNDLRRYFINLDDLPVERPIFLLGNQGGGLTLLSRILRRNCSLVCVSGGCDYWAGPDEMQSIARRILPSSLNQAGTFFGDGPSHPRLSPPRAWTYASNELYSKYRMSADDYSDEARARLIRVIRLALWKFAPDESSARFIDKSQMYTVKVPYIRGLLAEENPCFVLMTRNPYAACPRAAFVKAADMQRYASVLDRRERLELCCEHWQNAISTAIEDMGELDRTVQVRFEDLLREPQQTVRHVCDAVDLNFDRSMLPSSDDEMPPGSRFSERWYPIRTGVNEKYLQMVREEPWMANMVEKYCGKIAEKLGYRSPC